MSGPIKQPRSALQSFLVTVALGALAGALNLALDLTTTAAMLGFWLPIEPWHMAAYGLGGLAVALVVSLGGRWRPPPALLVATVISVLQLAALFERLHHALVARAPWPALILAAAVLIVGFLIWAHLLRWLLRPATTTTPVWIATTWALVLASLTSSAGLALNRNVVADVLSKSALLASNTKVPA